MARTYETNRVYELMFIVRPDMVEEEQDKLISTLESAVSSSGGRVKSMERMGKRRLAYTVRRFHDGIYILLTVEGGGALIHELERRVLVGREARVDAKAAVNISGARKFASSAWRRSRPSITRTYGCSLNLWRRAERSFHGA